MSISILTLVVTIITLSYCSLSIEAAEKLVFQDEFDTFDMKTWKHEITMSGGGNWEFEMYVNSRKNSFVSNGQLHLKPTFTADEIGEAQMVNGGTYDLWGGQPADQCTMNAFYGCSRTSNGVNIINPIQSARLRTAESFAFRYGRIEVRARLPRGDWMWPAIWLLPRDNAYGIWPSSGEIDIMESRGNTGVGGVSSMGSTLHWGPAWNQNAWPLTHVEYTLPTGDFSSDFHIFGLYWDQNGLYTYVDNDANRVLTVNMTSESMFNKARSNGYNWEYNPWNYTSDYNAPFNQEFFIIMNVAVGGTSGYFPDSPDKPWSNSSPQAALDFWQHKSKWYPSWQAAAKSNQAQMDIDWVRVYSLENDKPNVPSSTGTSPHNTVGSTGGTPSYSSTGATPIILSTGTSTNTTTSTLSSPPPTTIVETGTSTPDLTILIVAVVIAALVGCIIGGSVVFVTVRYLHKHKNGGVMDAPTENTKKVNTPYNTEAAEHITEITEIAADN